VSLVSVLLVDDQELFLDAMRSVVAEMPGFEVVGEASTGQESVRGAAVHAPDLVLMDVNLPGMDGLEATRRLRQLRPAPVVVLVSTHDEDAGARYVDECGAAAYVTKSALSPDRLREVWVAVTR
jgi:DNA-binding NarL/FixJ family response regulator